MIKLKKNKVTHLKIMPPKVSTLPIKNINSNTGGTGGGSNNATNSAGVAPVNGTNWINVPISSWYNYTIPSTAEEIEEITQVIKSDRDGLDCKSCKDFFQFVQSNQEDGTFICFKCRNGF